MTQTLSLRRAGILGTGSFVPPKVVTNDDFAARMDTSDEWIASRTGIRARRLVEPGVLTSDLAAAAARNALEDAGLAAADLDLIIVASSTPDYPGSFPSTATVVQTSLGAANAAAFDLGAVCSGFAYALHVAAQMVATGANRHVLVIGAETFSRVLNWDDRSTAVLFGDGAGAVIVGEVSEGGYLGGHLGGRRVGRRAAVHHAQRGVPRHDLPERARGLQVRRADHGRNRPESRRGRRHDARRH